MPTPLEIEPELASKIQARARERGVSVDVYLRELIEEKETESERSNGMSPQERVRIMREWASGHSTNPRFLLTMQPAAKASTERAVSVSLGQEMLEVLWTSSKRRTTKPLLIYIYIQPTTDTYLAANCTMEILT